MDISDTLAPNSDQLDAVDLLGSPRIFTITGVSKGNAEQPVQFSLAEIDRYWRPGKSMRRVLANCWGTDASKYVGRRVELFCDESVVFGGKPVGGTRISRMSDIDGPKKTPLLIKRGQSAMFTVAPLPPVGVDPTQARIDALIAEYEGADADRQDAIKAEVTNLRGGAA